MSPAKMIFALAVAASATFGILLAQRWPEARQAFDGFAVSRTYAKTAGALEEAPAAAKPALVWLHSKGTSRCGCTTS